MAKRAPSIEPISPPTAAALDTVLTVDQLQPDPHNRRRHTERNVTMVADALRHVGAARSIVVDEDDVVLAGNGVIEGAKQAGITRVRVIDADGSEVIAVRRRGLTADQKRALAIYDNRTAELAEWNPDQLRLDADAGLDLKPFWTDAELQAIVGTPATATGLTEPDTVPAPRPTDIQRGDLFALGRHRLLCGDSTQLDDATRLLNQQTAALCVTSPPYASQRTYDAASGFTPVAPDDYVEWFAHVQSVIAAVLAVDGSFCLNIKEHCNDGQRHLYVKDLTLAHVRRWGWRFIDEFCWRDSKNGVPGHWPNRFKDAWEPVFHYSRHATIKFRPLANGTASDGVFAYSPTTATATTGSKLLGARTTPMHAGIARPSNVLEIAAASTGDHSAAFPVALPRWFVNAFTDVDDVVFDPFGGSGTTLMAAEQVGRAGRAMEISPQYCQVIIDRWEAFTGLTATKVGESIRA